MSKKTPCFHVALSVRMMRIELDINPCFINQWSVLFFPESNDLTISDYFKNTDDTDCVCGWFSVYSPLVDQEGSCR